MPRCAWRAHGEGRRQRSRQRPRPVVVRGSGSGERTPPSRSGERTPDPALPEAPIVSARSGLLRKGRAADSSSFAGKRIRRSAVRGFWWRFGGSRLPLPFRATPAHPSQGMFDFESVCGLFCPHLPSQGGADGASHQQHRATAATSSRTEARPHRTRTRRLAAARRRLFRGAAAAQQQHQHHHQRHQQQQQQ